MIKPMRRALLNAEISREARRIAHAVTKTCRWKHLRAMSSDDADHTPACNALKREIEQLVLTIKLAEKQPSERPDPPPFELQQEDTP